jgi:membrane dipeptidase
MEISTKPVVFSHANVRALRDHPRNIDDVQIRACAATDGVIGLSGIGVFLGENDIRTETILRHVAYLAERVGTRHIGLGLDYVFEPGDNDLPATEDPEDWWPSAYGYNFPSLKIVPPEQLPEIADALVGFGFKDEEASAILGGNFLRAAEATWQRGA